MKDIKRLAQLNNVIFDGHNTATAIKINLTRDRDIPGTISRFKLNLDFDKVEIEHGTIIDIDPPISEEFAYSYDKEKIFDNVTTIKRCNYSYTYFSNFCIPGYVMSHNFSIVLSDDSDSFTLSNNFTFNIPFDKNKALYYNSSSGNTRRNFKQDLNFPSNIITLLIVYPNMFTIPLVFGYTHQDIDLNRLLSNDPDYSYSSFDKKFTFFDETTICSKETAINLDTNFVKVNSVLKTLEDEHFDYERSEEGDITKIKYDSPYIIGEFNTDGSDAEYYLKGEEKNYLLYSEKEKYNTNQYSFLKIITNIDPILYDSEAAHDALNMLKYTAGVLSSQISIYPLSNLKIYVDDNSNSYHILTIDEINGFTRVITLYNKEFAMIRDFYNLNNLNSNDFKLTLFKLNPDYSSEIIINSYISFLYDNDSSYCYMEYNANIRNKYEVSCSLKENDIPKEKLTTNDIYQEIEYHTIDVDNVDIIKIITNPNTIDPVRVITKFDSLLYNVDKIDEVIIRNYLGLPLNHKYIKMV